LVACGSDAKLDNLEIRTLSNRADLVSGGDVLVQIVPPAGAEAGSGLVVRVGTKDVTSAFARRADGRITGLVTGLADGDNIINAQMDLTKLAQLTVTNAPRSGPIISGAQIKPFYCATPTPQVVSGDTPATSASGLSGTPDANCNIARGQALLSQHRGWLHLWPPRPSLEHRCYGHHSACGADARDHQLFQALQPWHDAD
jgi:hypothetical protein